MATACSSVFRSHVFGVFVIFSTFSYLASSAAVSSLHRSLTIDSSANRNQCTDNSTWIGTGSTTVDCIGAVQRLYDAEVKPFSDTDFEFLSEKAPARSLPSMRTPRKYTVGKCQCSSQNRCLYTFRNSSAKEFEGSCTLAIVMLNFFSNGELPGGVEGPFASRDVTSFYEIWQAAQQIEATCLMQKSRPGWAAEGLPPFSRSDPDHATGAGVVCTQADIHPSGGRESVGVFLWATDSLENRRVPQGEPTLTTNAPIGLSGPLSNLSNGAEELLSHKVLETRSHKIDY